MEKRKIRDAKDMPGTRRTILVKKTIHMIYFTSKQQLSILISCLVFLTWIASVECSSDINLRVTDATKVPSNTARHETTEVVDAFSLNNLPSNGEEIFFDEIYGSDDDQEKVPLNAQGRPRRNRRSLSIKTRIFNGTEAEIDRFPFFALM
eukprot:10691794-Ditylum_brightwellii.AAC.1